MKVGFLDVEIPGGPGSPRGGSRSCRLAFAGKGYDTRSVAGRGMAAKFRHQVGYNVIHLKKELE